MQGKKAHFKTFVFAGVAAEVLQSAVQTLTSGSSGDRIVFRSAAATPLATDKQHTLLAPGDRRWFEVEVALPAVLPPSHRGTALRWSYFIVATATLGAPFPVTTSSFVWGLRGVSLKRLHGGAPLHSPSRDANRAAIVQLGTVQALRQL